MSIAISKDLLKHAFAAVKTSLKGSANSPLVKEAFRSGLLMGAGDVVCQIGIEKREFEEFDFQRNFRMTGFGFFLAGPAFFKWYRFLDGKIRAKGFQAALKKTFFDQTVFAPALLCGFLTYNEVMLGHSAEGVVKRFKESYWQTQLINWSVVPGLQLANFYFFPAAYRVVMVQLINVFRNTVLALAVGKKKSGDKTAGQEEELEESGGKEVKKSFFSFLPDGLHCLTRKAQYYQDVYHISFNLF
ncbi:protein Mpv17-like [Artemia franciscana]|uniref:protein Mpv17-like n=1 Tax=Artemia franciscana TaxID=6661 RepID=UPI0032DBC919